MKIIIAIDSFKGCLTSSEANEAAKSAVLQQYLNAEVICIPVSDGGEGWLDAFHSAIGGEYLTVNTHDALMRPIIARYLKKGDKAVIESAETIGLQLLTPNERNPMKTTSYGLGEIIAHAAKNGCDDIVVGLGGSATSDMGIGMLHALDNEINALSENERNCLPDNVRFIIATDVNNPLCGLDGAAYVFAPQKGATMEMVISLEKRDRRLSHALAKKMGYDCSENPGAGAAGGLGYAFMQFLDSKVGSGAEMILNAVHFDEIIRDADLIITGEGRADRQTLMGKLPSRILQHAQFQNIPTIILAGQISDEHLLINAGYKQVININSPYNSLEEVPNKQVALKNIHSSITCNLPFIL